MENKPPTAAAVEDQPNEQEDEGLKISLYLSRIALKNPVSDIKNAKNVITDIFV